MVVKRLRLVVLALILGVAAFAPGEALPVGTHECPVLCSNLNACMAFCGEQNRVCINGCCNCR